jgi:hypothetical protein
VIAAHHNFLAMMIPRAMADDQWALQSLESMLAHPFRRSLLQEILDAIP